MKNRVNIFKLLFKILFILFFIIILIIIIYLNIGQYKADSICSKQFTENFYESNGYYTHDNDQKNGIIFYTGAKVEPEAYAYLSLVEDVNIYIIKSPFNIAFLNQNKASDVIDDNEDVQQWYVAGHSLGGVVANNYAQNNSNDITGVIYLASYPTGQQNSELEYLSIYGTNDLVVGDYTNKKNLFLEEETEYVEIAGGNHSQFGCYGLQKGDGDADISEGKQHETVIKSIENFID